MEECSETLAFASEPVYASLANILAYQEERPQGGPPPQAREYNFLEIELKYGLLQVSTHTSLFNSTSFCAVRVNPVDYIIPMKMLIFYVKLYLKGRLERRK